MSSSQVLQQNQPKQCKFKSKFCSGSSNKNSKSDGNLTPLTKDQEEQRVLKELAILKKQQEDSLYKEALKKEEQCIHKFTDLKFAEDIHIFNVPIKAKISKKTQKRFDILQSINKTKDYDENNNQQQTHQKQNQQQQQQQNNIAEKEKLNTEQGNDQKQNIQQNSGKSIEKLNSENNDTEEELPYDGWIHCYQCGSENKEVIVLVHGYAGSAMTFVNCLNQLSKKYKVYAIDILGIGLSSRPDFDHIRDPQQILNYMVNSIEQFRVEINLNEKFTLLGHSFGGYLSAFYSMYYPNNLKRLLLVSPIGGTQKSEQEIQQQHEQHEQFLKESGFFKRNLFKYAKKMYHERIGPSGMLDKFWIPSNYIIKRYFKRRLELPEDQCELWRGYLRPVFNFPASTEKGFFDLFTFPRLAAKVSIESEMPKFLGRHIQYSNQQQEQESKDEKVFDWSLLDEKKPKIDIHFYYGEFDWMDASGSHRMHKKQIVNTTFTRVKDAGHQIVFENPALLSEYVNNFVE